MNRENLERSTRHIRRAGERLRGLLERSHRRRRWESETAAGYTIDDLDQDEVLRTGRLQSGSPRCPSARVVRCGDPRRARAVGSRSEEQAFQCGGGAFRDPLGAGVHAMSAARGSIPREGTSPSSWLDGRSSGMLFSCLMKRCAFSGAIFLLPGGFSQDLVTKLVVDHYRANEAREDISLYDSMCSIRDRLNQNLEVDHPVVSGEKLTKGPDDARTRFLCEKLRDAIATLAVVDHLQSSLRHALSLITAIIIGPFSRTR